MRGSRRNVLSVSPPSFMLRYTGQEHEATGFLPQPQSGFGVFGYSRLDTISKFFYPADSVLARTAPVVYRLLFDGKRRVMIYSVLKWLHCQKGIGHIRELFAFHLLDSVDQVPPLPISREHSEKFSGNRGTKRIPIMRSRFSLVARAESLVYPNIKIVTDPFFHHEDISNESWQLCPDAIDRNKVIVIIRWVDFLNVILQ